MEALGIDLTLIAYQGINFLVLLIVLTAAFHKPLIKLLDERQRTVKEGLENAAAAKERLDHAEERKAEIIAEAERQSRALIDEARSQAKDLQQKLEAEAQAKAEDVLARAEVEAEGKLSRLRGKMKEELAGMVLTATSKVLKEDVSSSGQKKHIEKIVSDMP